MQYFGGKARRGKKFSGILDEELSRPEYGGRLVEPFVGGYNIVPALRHATSAKCSDVHAGLIGMYQAYVDGWRPPTSVPRDLYNSLKAQKGSDPDSVFASFACSFAGKEWGGYATGNSRNYAAVAARGLQRKMDHASATVFSSVDYRDVDIDGRSVIYCDPPYFGTTGYRTGPFDSGDFFRWCEGMEYFGHAVFVSEFQAPGHWQELWSQEFRASPGNNTRVRKTDKLFRVRLP